MATPADQATAKGADHIETINMMEPSKPQDVQLDKFGAAAKSSPEEIALVRKLDMYMMPILWLMYFFSFLDRNAIVNAKIDNMDKDLGLKGTEYNTCVSVFFVGYLVAQIPANMMLNRVRPSIFMPFWILAWAIVSTLTALVKDFKGMLACRFILGLAEAPFYPGGVYLISLFYTRKESATRMSIFYTGNVLASAFSGLIAAGVFAGMEGHLGLQGWRWLFIIQGLLTVAIALLAFFLLPDTPLTTRWLTPTERQLAHTRISTDTTGKLPASTLLTGFRAALLDPRTWLFALLQNLHISANGFKNFLPSVISTLGFSRTLTLVLTCPPYLVAAVASVVVSWSSGRMNERTWHITLSKVVAIAGFVLGVATLDVGARYFAIFVFVGATYGVNNINLAWAASVLGQTDEKKAVVVAIVNVLASISLVYTPYLWPDGDAPRYTVAMVASVGFSAGVIVLAWVLRCVLVRDNRKLRMRDSEAVNFYVY